MWAGRKKGAERGDAIGRPWRGVDSFTSITAAIRRGRLIDHNIRAAMTFILAVHVPVVALALGPVLMHWPIMLLPAQIVLLELVIDPACTLAFESEQPESDLIRTSVFIALVSGVFMLVLASRSSRRAPGAGNLVRNPWLMRLALMAVALMALVLGLDPLRGLMGFALPTQGSALAVAVILVAEALAMALLRAIGFARRSRPAPS